jgi:hypothetical protein
MAETINAKHGKNFNWRNIGAETTRLPFYFQGAALSRFGIPQQNRINYKK